MPKKKTKQNKPTVHNELKGFNIKINEFGEITANLEIDKLNNFLNEKVEDKKLKEQAGQDKLDKE